MQTASNEEYISAIERQSTSRLFSRKPRQTNFAQIKKALDRDYLPYDRKIRQILTKTRDDVVQWAENFLKSNSDPGAIAALNIDSGSDLAGEIGRFLLHYWKRGRDIGYKELPAKIRKRDKVKALKTFGLDAPELKIYGADQLPEWYGVRTYQTGFSPLEAIRAFDVRKWLIKSVIDDGIRDDVRFELMKHLEGGRSIIETIKNIRQIFEPYIGDPAKIKPSGITGTPEDILQAYRLENIVRTESNWALTQGRLAIADAAEDFVQGLEYSGILDERQTVICSFASGGDESDTGEPIRVRADSPEAARLSPPNHFQALAEGTLISTNRGERPIEEIQPDDLVLTHKGRFAPVYAVMARSDLNRARELYLESGRVLRVTNEHPLLTLRGWKIAGNLQVGDVLFQDGEQFSGAEDIFLPNPDYFPSPLDEPLVPYQIFRLSRRAAMNLPVEFQIDHVSKESEVENIGADGKLMDAVSGFWQESNKYGFMLGRTSFPIDATGHSGLSTSSEASTGVSDFHSVGVHTRPSVGLFPLAPGPMEFSGGRDFTAYVLRGSDALTANWNIEGPNVLSNDIIADAEAPLDRTDRFAVLPMPFVDQFPKQNGVSVNHRWSPTKIVHISSVEINSKVWNLAVRGDETYIAEGVIVHNCRSTWIYLTTDDGPIKFSTEAQVDKAVRLIQKGFK